MMQGVVGYSPISSVQIQRVCASLAAIGGSVCALLLEASASFLKEGDLQSAAKQADVVLDISWEKLHTGPWKDVHMAWRDAYSLAALLSVQSQQLSPDSLAGALRTLDLAVMMGGPAFRPEVDSLITHIQMVVSESSGPLPSGKVDEVQALVTKSRVFPVNGTVDDRCDVKLGATLVCGEHVAGGSSLASGEESWQGVENPREDRGESSAANEREEVEETGHGLEQQRTLLEEGLLSLEKTLAGSVSRGENGERTDHERQGKRLKLSPPDVSLPLGSNPCSESISIRHVPSLESFLCQHMLQERPVVLTGIVPQWPAFQRWQDLGYLKRVAGLRTVPVEVGETYVAEKWRQELMTLAAFIERHVEGEERPEERGYLAQHSLFEQIPELRKDIVTPDYCTLGGGEMQSVNAWFGPPGTITPLHYDPHHNLLAQVVGRKYIRLYAPALSDAVYPHTEGMLTNTSRVDLDRPDGTAFPLFSTAPFLECVLEAGQMLYIPPRWWHYVKALSTSFSVSFWWAAE